MLPVWSEPQLIPAGALGSQWPLESPGLEEERRGLVVGSHRDGRGLGRGGSLWPRDVPGAGLAMNCPQHTPDSSLKGGAPGARRRARWYPFAWWNAWQEGLF